MNLTDCKTKFETARGKIFCDKVKNFFYSGYFLLIIACITIICWNFSLVPLGLIVHGLLITFLLFFSKDITVIFPSVLGLVFVFPPNTDISKYMLSLLILIPIAVGLIFHLVYYRKKFDKGQYFYPLLLVSVALVIGGIGGCNATQYLNGLPMSLFLGFGLFGLYVLFHNYSHMDDENIGEYLAKIMCFVGFYLFLEVMIFYVNQNFDFTNVDLHYDMQLGVVNSNGVAILLEMCIPLGFYLFLKSEGKKRYIYALIIVLEYTALFFTYSKAGIITTVLMTPFLVIYTGIKTTHKKAYWLVISLLAITVIAILIYKKDAVIAIADKVIDLFKNFSFDKLDEFFSTRITLYTKAIEVFLSNPLFGGSMGYYGCGFEHFYWYHNTILQILASMGIIGLFIFIYKYIVKFKIICFDMKKRAFNALLFMMFLAFEFHAMFETSTFMPMPAMTLVTFIVAMTELNNKRSDYEDFSKKALKNNLNNRQKQGLTE